MHPGHLVVRLAVPGGTPEQAFAFHNDEIARWAKVINTSGVKAEYAQ